MVSSATSSLRLRPKTFENQLSEASFADLVVAYSLGDPFRNRACCAPSLWGTGILGNSIDRDISSERVVGSNLIVGFRSSVTAGLIEYVWAVVGIGEMGKFGPKPPRAAMPSVADCDRGLTFGRI